MPPGSELDQHDFILAKNLDSLALVKNEMNRALGHLCVHI